MANPKDMIANNPPYYYDACADTNYTSEKCAKAKQAREVTPMFVNIISIGLIVLLSCLIFAMIYRYVSAAKHTSNKTLSAGDAGEQAELGRNQKERL